MDIVNCDKVLRHLGDITQCEKKWTTVPDDKKERTFELLYFYGLIKDIKNDQNKDIIALTKNGGRLILEYNRSIEIYLKDREKELGISKPKHEIHNWQVFVDIVMIIGLGFTLYFSWSGNKKSETERITVPTVEPKSITPDTKATNKDSAKH